MTSLHKINCHSTTHSTEKHLSSSSVVLLDIRSIHLWCGVDVRESRWHSALDQLNRCGVNVRRTWWQSTLDQLNRQPLFLTACSMDSSVSKVIWLTHELHQTTKLLQGRLSSLLVSALIILWQTTCEAPKMLKTATIVRAIRR